VIAVIAGALIAGCIVRHVPGASHLTGTCAGACDHYVECKPGHSEVDGNRCRAECPQVFADRDSLMAFENLSCANTVTFVDGDPHHSAKN
jgi:hypothetical protein